MDLGALAGLDERLWWKEAPATLSVEENRPPKKKDMYCGGPSHGAFTGKDSLRNLLCLSLSWSRLVEVKIRSSITSTRKGTNEPP